MSARAAVVAACVLLGACIVDDADEQTEPAEMTVEPVQPAPQPMPPVDTMMFADTMGGAMRFVVDISDRKLYVMRGGDTIRTEAVAVGMSDHPTPTGQWTIHQVDWNPDWTPPPGEEWTEDAEPQPPGSPENPMGRARLIFNMPYTIHGTDELQSLGKAASHGSIRVANEAVVELGRMIMDAGGATRPESFFQQVRTNRTQMHPVEIPRPIPVTVQQ
jgi:lipoprotein-anchoring transpeptidase ErfK/SrfK